MKPKCQAQIAALGMILLGNDQASENTPSNLRIRGNGEVFSKSYTIASLNLILVVLHAPKMRWLAAHAAEICLEQGRKLLLYTNWPMDQLLTEALLVEIGFRVVSMKSCHNQTERDEARRLGCVGRLSRAGYRKHSNSDDMFVSLIRTFQLADLH